jgi:hypothetical protein
VTGRADESDQGVTGCVRSLKTFSGTFLYFNRTQPQWRPVRHTSCLVANPSSPDYRARHLRVRSGEPQHPIVRLHFVADHYTDRTRPIEIETASGQEEKAQNTLDHDAA